MVNFWQSLPKPFFVLAPMEDVTDVVFRHVIAQAARPDVFFTEFTNSESYCHPQGIDSVKGRLLFTDDEQPIVAHIWGDRPEYFAQMSIGMAQMGFKGIDINMGCPAPNVVKHGRGAGLIQRFETTANIIKAAKTGGLPVSVKTRLGYSHVSEYQQWLTHLLKQDLANISIHLRTKSEMSKAAAHYELIPAIKALRDTIAPHTLLTINGDIADYQAGMNLVQQYGIDGIMIGRGVFHNPFAFEKVSQNHSPLELLNLLLYHLDTFDYYAQSLHRPYKVLHRFFKIYVRDFSGAATLRNQLMQTESTNQARQLVTAYIKKHKNLLIGGFNDYKIES